MPFMAMLFMSIITFFFLTILVNYFFILERNVKKHMGIVINDYYFHIQPLCHNNSLSKYFLVEKYI